VASCEGGGCRAGSEAHRSPQEGHAPPPQNRQAGGCQGCARGAQGRRGGGFERGRGRRGATRGGGAPCAATQARGALQDAARNLEVRGMVRAAARAPPSGSLCNDTRMRPGQVGGTRAPGAPRGAPGRCGGASLPRAPLSRWALRRCISISISISLRPRTTASPAPNRCAGCCRSAHRARAPAGPAPRPPGALHHRRRAAPGPRRALARAPTNQRGAALRRGVRGRGAGVHGGGGRAPPRGRGALRHALRQARPSRARPAPGPPRPEPADARAARRGAARQVHGQVRLPARP